MSAVKNLRLLSPDENHYPASGKVLIFNLMFRKCNDIILRSELIEKHDGIVFAPIRK